uniref:Lymphotoxin-alpha n=1 Tax=Mola mola TaxID=94237 RepID=A0A3Q3X373_MOLML
MVEYATAQSDVEMGLEERTVVLVEKKSSTGRLWRVSGALLFVALCFGLVLLFFLYWNGRPEMLTNSRVFLPSDPHYTLSRISSKAKAAIHLEGESYSESFQNRLEWKNGQGQAFAQGGFQLENNKIIIPETGLYFVYSQASFSVSCSDSDSDREVVGKGLMPLSHRVWRYSDSIGSPASLMSAVRSACQNTALEGSYRDGQGWYNNIYLGAVFQLNRGDKLWTETNQLSELDTEEGNTFFGVFAL